MHIPSLPARSNSFLRLPRILLSLVLLAGIVGCGGGSSSSSSSGGGGNSSNEKPGGLYTSGTGTLDTLAVSDIIAFVYNNRIIAFSATAEILIDGEITNIDEDEYTAIVNVYKDGVLNQAGVGVSGMVNNGSSISGTLNGSGVGAGDFSITFDLLYNRGASTARIDTAATAKFGGNVYNNIANASTTNFDSKIPFFYDLVVDLPGAKFCNGEGDYSIPNGDVNIYVLINHKIEQFSSECIMSDMPNYTGFATIVDAAGVDDSLLYAITNGINSEYAVLTR